MLSSTFLLHIQSFLHFLSGPEMVLETTFLEHSFSLLLHFVCMSGSLPNPCLSACVFSCLFAYLLVRPQGTLNVCASLSVSQSASLSLSSFTRLQPPPLFSILLEHDLRLELVFVVASFSHLGWRFPPCNVVSSLCSGLILGLLSQKFHRKQNRMVEMLVKVVAVKLVKVVAVMMADLI